MLIPAFEWGVRHRCRRPRSRCTPFRARRRQRAQRTHDAGLAHIGGTGDDAPSLCMSCRCFTSRRHTESVGCSLKSRVAAQSGGEKRRALSGMATSPYSPSITDSRRLLALAAAAENFDDMAVVVAGDGCVGLTSLTPFLVTTGAKEAHARRELDLVVVSALLGDSAP